MKRRRRKKDPDGVPNEPDATLCDVELALRCILCDAGDDPLLNSVDAALILGWTDIVCDHDGLSWNHLGTCPECVGVVR